MVCIRTALALLVSLNVLSPVAVAGVDGNLPEARMMWRLSFGDDRQPLQTGYGLTVGYRSLDGAPAGDLLELDVSEQAALARLAGLPLFQRDYRAQQNQGGIVSEAGSSPWYARKWVWWTAGSLAATAALAGGGGSSDTTLCTGVCNQNNTSGNGSSINGVGPDGFACVDDTCVVPCEADNKPAGCVEFSGRVAAAGYAIDPETLRWLDAGTGHMGDLIAR